MLLLKNIVKKGFSNSTLTSKFKYIIIRKSYLINSNNDSLSSAIKFSICLDKSSYYNYSL